MILSVQNVSKSFGTDEILKNVSFHIEDHEKAAVVGINGAGKSTLLKIIVGELTPDTGEVITAKGKSLGDVYKRQVNVFSYFSSVRGSYPSFFVPPLTCSVSGY